MIDELNVDWASLTKADMYTIIKQTEEQNEKLREESIKYHGLYVHAIADAETWHLQWSAEHQENAKLRTFIDLKETCWKYVGLCDECPYSGVDDEHNDCNCMVREKVNSLARELGIEVPDGS